jgi:hypothetical protein
MVRFRCGRWGLALGFAAALLLGGALPSLPAAADKDEPVLKVQFSDGEPPPFPAPPMPRGADSMRFGLVVLTKKDAEGKPKRLTYDPIGRTNNTVLRVDGRDIIFGDALDANGEKQGEWIERVGKLDARADGSRPQGARSVWRPKAAPVVVTQLVEIVPADPGPGETGPRLKMCLVRYKIENTVDAELKVGLRFLLDTFIGANDGVPFVIPGQDKLALTRQEFTAPDVPDFIFAQERYDPRDPKDRGTVAQVTFHIGMSLEKPSRVHLGGWPDAALEAIHSSLKNAPAGLANEVVDNMGLVGGRKVLSQGLGQYTLWDVPQFNIRGLNDLDPLGFRPRGKKPFDPDSAVTMYWDVKTLKPGAVREVGFAYGLGNVPGDGGDERILLNIAGRKVPDGEFTLNALVSDPRDGERLTLELPKGFKLLKGDEATKSVPPAVGERKQSPVTWRIRADDLGPYTLKVTSSATDKPTLLPLNIKKPQGVFD